MVGQAPGPKTSPGASPLSGRSGSVLAGCAGISLEEFLEAFARVNVFRDYPGPSPRGGGDAFPEHLARERARAVLLLGRPVVFLGREVARAFGFENEYFRWGVCRGKEAVTVPHPSGLNRMYNDPKVRSAVGDVLRMARRLSGG